MTSSTFRAAAVVLAAASCSAIGCGGDLHLGSDAGSGGAGSGGKHAGSGASSSDGGSGGQGCASGSCSDCTPGETRDCGTSSCGPKTQLCADGEWSSCQAPTCTDPGPVECLGTTPAYAKFDMGGRSPDFSLAGSSSDRILVITPTTKGGAAVTVSDTTTFDAWTMKPDGSDVQPGAFFDRGGALVLLHQVVWVDPYYYVVWHEQPSSTTWVGRMDHDGKTVGDPLAVGTQGDVIAIAARDQRIEIAHLGTAASQLESVVQPLDPGTFTLGAPVTLTKGSASANTFFTPTSVAILGSTTAIAGRAVDNEDWTTVVYILDEKGTPKRHAFNDLGKGPIDPGIAANGGTLLLCSADPDGSFGLGRDAFHQWCATLSSAGALGAKTDLGYRSNFLSLAPQPFFGGFVVDLPGGDQSASGLTSPWQHLAIVDLDGAKKEAIDVTLPSPMGDSFGPPIVVTGDCVEMVHFGVDVFQAPDQEQSGLDQYCKASCP